MPKTTQDFDTDELDLHGLLPARASACPPLDVLLALQQDVLPEEIAGPARDHLARCSLCTMLLADMAELPEPVLSAGGQEHIAAALPNRKAHAPSWLWRTGLIGLAAAMLLAVGISLWHGRNTQMAQTIPVRSPAPTLQGELPFSPLASPSDSGALLTRGSSDGHEPTNEALLPAFRAYNQANYAAAMAKFEQLSATYPKNGMILLYLGVSQLALRQDQQAAVTLQQARESRKPYDPDSAEWYSAIAASRVHHVEARSLLDNLCLKSASAYSARSCEALRASEAKP